jgi:hypothetical protein
VPTFRSNSNIVIPAASTGRDVTSRNLATKIAHTNILNFSRDSPLYRDLMIVIMKLSLPSSDEIPEECSLKITKSTLEPGCPRFPLSGG